MPRVSRSGGAGGGGLEAQREIVDTIVIRLQEFLDGERDFDDAVTVEDTIVEVDVCPDGSIMDENGNGFR